MPMPGNRCSVHAPAKLNLCLELLGKRDDGFHALRTVMGTVGWCDTVRVQDTGPAPGDDQLRLRVLGAPEATAGVPTDRSNLVLRALELLRQESGTTHGAEVELVKRVPNEAGLGGGSSDAAAALTAGNRVWGLGWSIEQLAVLAARLGSDLPFFVHAIGNRRASFAVATGRGEVIRPLQAMTALPVVIVKPPAGLATAEVYRACEKSDYVPTGANDRTSSVAEAVLKSDLCGLAGAMTNGLQAAAMRLAPWIRELAKRFEASGCRGHQLSGSGSAYFGLMQSMREANRVAARLRALRVGQVVATTIG
ncbi:MAG: 4-(cytidine 5'-diphospho)-2-C-methyl-D-erythritol kinase [Planctomycetota bacterium]